MNQRYEDQRTTKIHFFIILNSPSSINKKLVNHFSCFLFRLNQIPCNSLIISTLIVMNYTVQLFYKINGYSLLHLFTKEQD